MKYAIVADNHLCDKSSVISGRGKFYSDRLENQIESFKWVTGLGYPIIHLGDFFDRSTLKAEEVQAFTDEIEPLLAKTAKDNIFLLGNHEYSGSYDLLSPLGKQIIRKPTEMVLGDLKCLFLPFNSTEEDITGDYDIIFGHIGIKDIPFGAKGFNFEVIDSHCKFFLNGHLHNRHKFSDTKWNVGSLTAQNFSDDGIKGGPKGIWILDTDKKSIEFVANPFGFNFFKIVWDDFKNCQNEELWNRITSKTACVSISCQEGQKEEIIKSGKFDEVYYLRVSEIHKEKILDSKEVLSPIDHLDKFRKSFIEKVGESQLVLEELSEVLR